MLTQPRTHAPPRAAVTPRRRSLDKAEDFARRHNVPKAYASAAELLADPDVDAVYIATPPGSHLEIARLVATAGALCRHGD